MARLNLSGFTRDATGRFILPDVADIDEMLADTPALRSALGPYLDALRENARMDLAGVSGPRLRDLPSWWQQPLQAKGINLDYPVFGTLGPGATDTQRAIGQSLGGEGGYTAALVPFSGLPGTRPASQFHSRFLTDPSSYTDFNLFSSQADYDPFLGLSFPETFQGIDPALLQGEDNDWKDLLQGLAFVGSFGLGASGALSGLLGSGAAAAVPSFGSVPGSLAELSAAAALEGTGALAGGLVPSAGAAAPFAIAPAAALSEFSLASGAPIAPGIGGSHAGLGLQIPASLGGTTGATGLGLVMPSLANFGLSPLITGAATGIPTVPAEGGRLSSLFRRALARANPPLPAPTSATVQAPLPAPVVEAIPSWLASSTSLPESYWNMQAAGLSPVSDITPTWLPPAEDTSLLTEFGEPIGTNAYFPELAAPQAPALPTALPLGLPTSPIPSVLTPPPPAPTPVPPPPTPPLDLQRLLVGGAVAGAGSTLLGRALGGESTTPPAAPGEFDLATGAPRAGIGGGTAGIGLQIPPAELTSDFGLGPPISEFGLGGGPSGIGISGTTTPSTASDIIGVGSTAVGRVIDQLTNKGSASVSAAGSTATGRVIDQLLGKGDASASDWASVLGTLGATGLSLVGSERQQDRLSDLFNIARTDRLPALTAFNQALIDPNSFYASAPATGAVDAVLRRLSTLGNPAANPASLARAAAYNLGGYTDYLRGLSPAAFGTSGIEATLGSQLARNTLDPFRTLATGLSELINPRVRSNISLSDLLQQAGIV